MSASGVSTTKADHGSSRSSGEWFAQARWLARNDIRKSWLSYLLSGLYMLFFGLLVTPSLAGSVALASGNLEASPGSVAPFFADFLFVIMGCILVVNFFSMDYLRLFTSDVFSERTAFLLSLPLSTSTLVTARVISMLAATPFTAIGFFLPAYLLTDLRELGFSYLWFVGIWLGWGIAYAGVTLLCELGLSGRAYCYISLALIASFLLLVILIEGAFGISLLGGSIFLVANYGPIPTLVSVVVGSLVLWLLTRLTIRRVDGREVGV